VVTRTAISIDPETARAEARLDSLPQILDGIPIAYRGIRVVLDRPGFALNPTSCAATSSRARLTSAAGAVASVSDRFQVGGCASLGFKPRVSVRLLGPTHRGAHPRLRAVVSARRGDASIRSAAITLPGTELLESRHLGQVCGTARFTAGTCPSASVYGHARAWTPLLRRPLEGPVYLRASDSELPDLALSLRGQLRLDLTARVDSVHGRLRTKLEQLPDVPLSKVVLTMKGGGKGLLTNTGGLCRGEIRAKAKLDAQNGKAHVVTPAIGTGCDRPRRAFAE
jgi:hypothetical protein